MSTKAAVNILRVSRSYKVAARILQVSRSCKVAARILRVSKSCANTVRPMNTGRSIRSLLILLVKFSPYTSPSPYAPGLQLSEKNAHSKIKILWR